MKYQFNIIFTGVIFSLNTLATGLPVVDTTQLLRDSADSVYLLGTIGDFLSELGTNTQELQALGSLSSEITDYQNIIRDYQGLSAQVEDLDHPIFLKTNILSSQISNLTAHVRRIKSILTVSGALVRPQAFSAALKMMEIRRKNERDKFELSMRAAEEKEKIYEMKKKLQRKLEFKKQLDREMEIISQSSKNSIFRTVILDSKMKSSGSTKGATLW